MRLIIFFLLFSFSAHAGNILTTNGLKSIEQIKVGDSVIGQKGINVVTGKKLLSEQWNNNLISHQWYLINDKYRFYSGQNIFVALGDYGVCHVNELKYGWLIYLNGNLLIVTSIKAVSGSCWTKLDISGDHSYIEDGILVHNAARFWNKQNASANWNATAPTNWGSSSGTADGASVPGASDDVTLDGAGAGGNASGTISASISLLSLTFTTGYTATVTQNTGQNITLNGNFTDQTQHSWASSTGQIVIQTASTITSNGKTYPNSVTFSGTNTKTLSGDWTISGTLAINGLTTLNSGTLTAAGLNTTTSGIAAASTGTVLLSGGTWTGSAGTIACNLTYAGNVTLSGSLLYNTGTMTYTSGTITTTGSTVTLSGSCTLNTNGMSFNNITLNTNSTTITNNSLCTITGTLTYNDGIGATWAGTAGFTAGTVTFNNTTAATENFKDGNTYTITTALNCFKSRNGSIVTISSSHATNTTAIVLQNGASCDVLANFTRVDASGGRTIWTFNGTLTTTTNINSFTDLKTVSKSFVQ